jgi:hypothetical protein
MRKSTRQQRAEVVGSLDAFRQFFASQRDVPALALFAFGLGLQVTTGYLPEHVIGLDLARQDLSSVCSERSLIVAE